MEFSFFHFAQPANAWSEPGNVAFQTVAYSLNVWCADVTSLITASVQRCTGWPPDCLQTLVWIPKVGTRRKNLLQVLKPCGVCRWHQRFHRQSPCLAPSAQAEPRRPRQVVTEAPRPHTLRARRPCRDCSLCHAWSPEFRRFPQFRKALPQGLRPPPPLVASESLDLCPCSSGTWPTARQPRRTPRLPESPPTLLGSAILSRNRLRFCD